MTPRAFGACCVKTVQGWRGQVESGILHISIFVDEPPPIFLQPPTTTFINNPQWCKRPPSASPKVRNTQSSFRHILILYPTRTRQTDFLSRRAPSLQVVQDRLLTVPLPGGRPTFQRWDLRTRCICGSKTRQEAFTSVRACAQDPPQPEALRI